MYKESSYDQLGNKYNDTLLTTGSAQLPRGWATKQQVPDSDLAFVMNSLGGPMNASLIQFLPPFPFTVWPPLLML